MKTITCLDCDEQFTGTTPEEVMKAMMPHYMKEHQDVMAVGTDEKKVVWYEEFERRWIAASEQQ